MSLSPAALEALRAAQSAFSTSDADVFEDALARGLEAADREGRIVGAYQAQELKRLVAQVAELERQIAALSAQQQVLQARPAEGITRVIAPTQVLSLEDPHDGPLAHQYRVSRDLPETGGGR